LAFIRLFALFKYHPSEKINTLVMFDESTSAVDTETEAVIYQLMNDLHIWFVTISHRPSLIKYHHKELKLSSPNLNNRENELNLNDDFNTAIDIPIDHSSASIRIGENLEGERQLMNVRTDNTMTGYIEIKNSGNWWKEFLDVWKIIHLPFGPNDKKLRIQVNSIILMRTSILVCSLDLCNMVYLFTISWKLCIYILSFNCSNWCYF
jgi:hypothetical protein